MKASERLARYLEIGRVRALCERARQAYERTGRIAHNWDHVHRGILNAVAIGEAEGADMDIVLPAAILHDIGFLYDRDPAVHHSLGAEKCVEWLEDWSAEDRERIARCILSHKGRMKGFDVEPERIEEKVVCDADLLEKTGWLGVLQAVRAFVEFAESGDPQLRTLMGVARAMASVRTVFYTGTGRALGEARGGFLRVEAGERAVRELEEYL